MRFLSRLVLTAALVTRANDRDVKVAAAADYIDFAAAHGVEYVVIDEGWYKLGNVLDVVPEINVGEIVEPAGVRTSASSSGRELEVDFSFLPAGVFRVESFRDGVNADRFAGDYKRLTGTLRRTDRLKIKLADGGGWAARIRPGV